MKRLENSLRDLWDNINHTNIRIIGVPEEEEKKKAYEEFFFKRLQLKISPTWKRNSQSSSRGTKRSIQDKSKDKHAKTHTNQTNKD